MFTFFAPVLSLMARILIAFSVTFLVPGIWAWFEDHQDLQLIWLAVSGLTALSGLALAAITQNHFACPLRISLSFLPWCRWRCCI